MIGVHPTVVACDSGCSLHCVVGMYLTVAACSSGCSLHGAAGVHPTVVACDSECSLHGAVGVYLTVAVACQLRDEAHVVLPDLDHLLTDVVLRAAA